MALFVMKRYWGDDEKSSIDKEILTKPPTDSGDIIKEEFQDHSVKRFKKSNEIKLVSGTAIIDECDHTPDKRRKNKTKSTLKRHGLFKESSVSSTDNIEKTLTKSKLTKKDDSVVEKNRTNSDKNLHKIFINDVKNEYSFADVIEKEERKELNVALPSDTGGFTVLGRVQENRKSQVRRTLPDWIRCPQVISSDLLHDQKPLSYIPQLSQHIVRSLHENNVDFFFPVQLHVIPEILSGASHGLYHGKAGYRPRDICCSAPTGSGKTLSFVIPIIQLLQDRVVPQVRCLVLLPVIDLAMQVYSVFVAYAKPTNLKIAVLTGRKSFRNEQDEIVRQSPRGYMSCVDIIITTPGRLVDHIASTRGLNLHHLRFLVIDEADRMISELKQDWLERLQEAVFSSGGADFETCSSVHCSPPGALTAANALKMKVPLQKLIFSATLSQNPEILQQLELFRPRLYTSLRHTSDAALGDSKSSNTNFDDREDLIGSLVKPKELREYYCEISPEMKPLVMVHLLKDKLYKHVLCFTKSVLSANRLTLVLRNVGGIRVREMSSNISVKARSSTLAKFAEGKIDCLVCTDAMTRGIDISNVKYVISYDTPCHLLTHIHRIGRTARAGKPGTAITLLTFHQVRQYKQMQKNCGGNITRLPIDRRVLSGMVPLVECALKKSATVVSKKSQWKKCKASERTH